LSLLPDGTGRLITKRGDLAAINNFSFKTMDDIIEAIKQGAEHLVEFEKNPPPKDVPAVTTPSNQNPAAATEATEDVEETSTDDIAETSDTHDAEPDIPNTTASPTPISAATSPDNGDLAGVTQPATTQQQTLF
jgi:hypothetical protein